MQIDESILNDLIEIYRVHYKIELTKRDAQEIAERIVHLFDGLRRSGIRPPDADADIRS